jgi:glycosyltransferase involved in cell wall biosynthesis
MPWKGVTLREQGGAMKSSKIEIDLPPVSVIIPAYNEEKWIETTLSSILESNFPCEVIVVNDGSTDRTPQILECFGAKIQLITHEVNKGKGAAVVSALQKASGEIVVFCDAHLLGLSKYHLLSMVLPLIYSSVRVVLGECVPEEISLARVFSPTMILTGQRAYYKEDLLPLAKEMEGLGYGLETFLFNRFPRDRTAVVLLRGLTHLIKKDTSSPRAATLAYLREVKEILDTLVSIEGIMPKEVGQLKKTISSLLAKYETIVGKS